MKKVHLFVALASALLATSCAEDVESTKAMSNSTISVHPTMGSLTRAAETTTANLQSFKTYAFQSGDDKNYMDGVTYNNAGGEWTTSQGDFYWPVSGDLNFYSYAPEKPGETGEFTVTPTEQKLTGFTPFSTADTQQDFIYSKASGNLKSNGTSGVDINFSHALSEITVAAKNDNKAYTVEVSGVKIGNVTSKGDFTFPTLEGGDAAWTLGTDKSDYITEWNSVNTLSADASTLDASNTAFMLIPQQLQANDKAIDGNYIALKVKITMQGGQVVHDGWAYVAVPTLWEMGKHYTYTLDYSNGAGQDENGNPIISGTGIKFNVTVTPWDEENKIIPNLIYGINSDSENFTVKINDEDVNVVMKENGAWSLDLLGKKITNLKNAFDSYPNENKIEYLNLAGLSTSEVTSMRLMFDECSKLNALDVSNFDTKNVTNMAGMFQECSQLKTLDVTHWKTANVTDMAYMFYGCSSLTDLDVSKWNTENVTSMRTMFYNASKLTSLDLSSWDVSRVEDMSHMFNRCFALTTLDLSSFVTQNVTDMYCMFNYCRSIKTLNLSNFKTSKVTNMHHMFSGCASLTSLNLSSFDTSNVTDMVAMFNDCVSLVTLDLSGWNINNVTDMSNMFNNCKSLKTVYMVGCDEATITKVKTALKTAGISTDIVKTSR